MEEIMAEAMGVAIKPILALIRTYEWLGVAILS